jgi:hypothetical protein
MLQLSTPRCPQLSAADKHQGKGGVALRPGGRREGVAVTHALRGIGAGGSFRGKHTAVSPGRQQQRSRVLPAGHGAGGWPANRGKGSAVTAAHAGRTTKPPNDTSTYNVHAVKSTVSLSSVPFSASAMKLLPAAVGVSTGPSA